MRNPFIDENGVDRFPYQPLKSIVFVLVAPEIEKVGSIVIPEEYRRGISDEVGLVVAVGKGSYIPRFKKYVPTTIKVGDIVVYDAGIPWSMEIKDHNGNTHFCKYFFEYDCQGYFKGDYRETHKT